ncbi:tetratricopeptide repeat-containing sensor histidine kinase [Pseudoflavitalea rhizosphaerae]|uniref:tetratricopeptide repeat-containing sensor histidine kinase n=1 Tax=Pseudoflavitalea rhizosphaerae TaxID=1884793 RepID=UPI000F8C540C|nr:sensor histidine kinase [Pseudoflavitalea rhizosphaerae]
MKVLAIYSSLFLSVVPVLLQSQVIDSAYVDSLVNIQKNTGSDSTRARACYLLAYYWSAYDSTKAWDYLEAGRKYNGKNKYLEAVYLFHKGAYFFGLDHDKAIRNYQEAAKLFSNFTNPESYRFQSRCWGNYGALQQRKDNEPEMVNVLLTKAIPFAEKSGDTALAGNYYSDVGMVFSNQLLHTKAAYYFNKALDYFKKSKPALKDEVMTLLHAARNFCLMDSLKDAKPLLERIRSLLKPFPYSDRNIDLAITEAIYFRKINYPEKALRVIGDGIKLAEKLNRQYSLSEALYQEYKTWFMMGHYKQALASLQKVMRITPYEFDDNRVMHYKEMARVYEAMGNISKAYEWVTKYSALQDTVYKENLAKQIADNEARYHFVTNEKKIIQLQAERQEAALEHKNQQLLNWLLGVAASLFLLATLFLILFYRNKRKQTKLQWKEMQQQQELMLANAMLEGEEQERQRLARDLHDGLGGALAGIKIKLSGQQKKEKAPQLNEVILQLEDSINELRRIARNMMPENLQKAGLDTALRDLCESLMNDNTSIEFHAFGIQPTIPLNVQANIYRIVQELLSNAVRHANASKIIVQCSQNGNTFFITVEDNGQGFDLHTIGDAEGIGFRNIRNRIKYLNGNIDIESVPAEGTTINIELHV